MDTRFRRSLFSAQPPSAPCAQCGTKLSAPEWTEPVGEARERHLWTCHACGYSFETLVVFAEEIHDRAA